MAPKSLLKLIEEWHEQGEHERIVDMLHALPEKERDYNITCLLARALNNIGRCEEAMRFLESVGTQGQDDALWHFRTGYSLFYIGGREAEAIPYFERAIELGDDYPSTYELLSMARSYREEEGQRETAEGESADEMSFDPKAYATLSLNMRLQPQHRGDLIEEWLDIVLRDKGMGCISGGGTSFSPDGEPESCDIEMDLVEDSEDMRQNVLSLVQKLEVAKGSKLIYRSVGSNGKIVGTEKEYPIGRLEGIAVYLNGADLPDEIYRENDVNEVIGKLVDLLRNNGELIFSYWVGPTETALYFYGEGGSEAMLKKVTPFLNDHPLCQKCRTVRLANAEPVSTNSRDLN